MRHLKNLDRLELLEKGLSTAANVVDENEDMVQN